MKRDSEIAESYRLRAEELRVIAEMDRDVQTRETLTRIASDYERMAATMDGITTKHEEIRREH